MPCSRMEQRTLVKVRLYLLLFYTKGSILREGKKVKPLNYHICPKAECLAEFYQIRQLWKFHFF